MLKAMVSYRDVLIVPIVLIESTVSEATTD